MDLLRNNFKANAPKETVRKEGWLYKKGSLRKNWKKRWFVLYFNSLAYMAHPNSSEVLGVIPLEDSVVAEEADLASGYRFCFAIFSSLGRDHVLRGHSEGNVLSWLVEINRSRAAHVAAKIHHQRETHQQRKQWIMSIKFSFGLHYAESARRKGAGSLAANSSVIASADPQGRLVPIFGVELSEVLKRDGEQYHVPFLCSEVIQYLLANAPGTKGVFRICGNTEDTLRLKRSFEMGEIVDLSSIRDVHTVGSLLKMYLRELPTPLGTFDLYPYWIAALQVQDTDAKVQMMRELVGRLPRPNRDLLLELANLLLCISDNSDVNQMTINNLSIVFAPNLFRAKDETALGSLQSAPKVLSVTRTLLIHKEEIFRDATPVPVAMDSGSKRASSYRSANMSESSATLRKIASRGAAKAVATEPNEEELHDLVKQVQALLAQEEEEKKIEKEIEEKLEAQQQVDEAAAAELEEEEVDLDVVASAKWTAAEVRSIRQIAAEQEKDGLLMCGKADELLKALGFNPKLLESSSVQPTYTTAMNRGKYVDQQRVSSVLKEADAFLALYAGKGKK